MERRQGLILRSATGTIALSILLSILLLSSAAPGLAQETQAPPTPYFQAAAFVTHLYQQILGRDPSEPELQQKCTDLMSGLVTGGEMAEEFFLSDEFRNRGLGDSEFVDLLYLALFMREAADEEKGPWIEALGGGQSQRDLLTAFLGSGEFVKMCGRFGVVPSLLANEQYARWTVGHNMCCTNEDVVTYAITFDGSSQFATNHTCSGPFSWGGYTYATPGIKHPYVGTLSGCATATITGTSMAYTAGQCYLFYLQYLGGGTLRISQSTNPSCTSPYNASAPYEMARGEILFSQEIYLGDKIGAILDQSAP